MLLKKNLTVRIRTPYVYCFEGVAVLFIFYLHSSRLSGAHELLPVAEMSSGNQKLFIGTINQFFIDCFNCLISVKKRKITE